MSFGVVPLDTSAWKPEMAPHAMVMKTNGNSLPLKSGPVPSTNCVSAGIFSVGCMMMIAMASRPTHAQLQERGQVVARRQQQPHRQDRRQPKP